MKQLILIAGLLFPLLGLTGPVNINSADAEVIARELKGIGLSKAQAIVNYRDEHGSFESADELIKIRGIGPKVLEDNRDNILLNDPQ